MQSLNPTLSSPRTGFWPTLVARLPQRRFDSPFLIRLRHWEYWPFEVVYFPVFIYWIWLSIKARSPFFFSAANPSIESGGLLGESKIAILDRISDEFKPKTLFVPALANPDMLGERLAKAGISFPIIAKPDVGERGWRVEKLHDLTELTAYRQETNAAFLIQEYVNYPLELGVFYYRFPGQDRGTISSIVRKEFLSIQGNGIDCVETLIGQNERARLQWPVLRVRYAHRLEDILAPGETLLLIPIGNHSRGTKFLDGNDLITPDLARVFDRISQSIDGFYFGRFDLRCSSGADLYAGRNIRILELNGAGAEPAHIYQPGASIRAAYRALFHHWRVLYDISRENHRRGVAYMTLREAVNLWQRIRSQKK